MKKLNENMKCELGESHFVCFEDLENWTFNASAASKEFHIANLLNEVHQDSGKASLILWTCRNGEHLDEALIWLADNFDLIPDAVNENIPSLGFKTSNKIFANVYLDDRALNVADF